MRCPRREVVEGVIVIRSISVLLVRHRVLTFAGLFSRVQSRRSQLKFVCTTYLMYLALLLSHDSHAWFMYVLFRTIGDWMA